MRPLAAAALAMLVQGCLYGSCPDAEDTPPIETASYTGTTADAIAGYDIQGPVAVDVDAEAELVTMTFQSEGRTVQLRYRITDVRTGYE